MVNWFREWTPFIIFMAILLGVSFVIAQAIPSPRTTTIVINYQESPTALSKVSPSAIAKELLDTRSYKCWVQIVKSESHFNVKAHSSISDASGIGQLLSGTYKSLGMKPNQSDGTAQLVAMLAYLNRHYSPAGDGAICNAWAYWKKNQSY